MAFTEDSTKDKFIQMLTRMPMQMELHESAQHCTEWIARLQHNAQIPSAPPMSLVLKVFSFCKQLLVHFILRCCTM